MIEPFHRKASETLSAIMRDLNLSNSCFRILSMFKDVTVENTLKLMEKCGSMLEARGLIYSALRDLDKHESLVKDIRHIIDLNLSESLDLHTITQIKTLAMKLPSLTQKLR